MGIRFCTLGEIGIVLDIINDAATAYRGFVPPDCLHDPYMSRTELESEVEAGVIFWGYEQQGILAGIMGIQDRGTVTLIRHAYVRTELRNQGIGSLLLRHLESLTDKPILIGTWAAASWAVRFYVKHGYRVLSPEETDRLLRTYWNIPDRQIETSVVLANRRWPASH